MWSYVPPPGLGIGLPTMSWIAPEISPFGPDLKFFVRMFLILVSALASASARQQAQQVVQQIEEAIKGAGQ